jgi:hypothetical protein
MARRSSKEAGLDGLSAFCVARRRSSRALVVSWRAVLAMWRWASVGGLKEASNTYSVVGGGTGGPGGMVASTSKSLLEAIKRFRRVA